MSDHSDSELVNHYLQGDQPSLEILVARYLRTVYFFIFQYTKNKADADDITQETFIKVWRHLKKFDTKRNFKTWILRIAYNTAIDFFRKKKDVSLNVLVETEATDYLNFVSPASESLPEELFDRQDLVVQLKTAMAKLSTPYQTVLTLHYQEQLTFQEIADIFGESINTIKSRHYRAIGDLRHSLSL